MTVQQCQVKQCLPMVRMILYVGCAIRYTDEGLKVEGMKGIAEIC